MPNTINHDAWPDDWLDRLARGMFPLVFGRHAPAPAAGNVVMLDSRRPACTR